MNQVEVGSRDEAMEEKLRQQIVEHPVLLFMKGSPEQPQCGFSARACQVLMACGQPFAYVDIFADPQVRASLPKVSQWPTFPQLFVGGELIGGSDIIWDTHQAGELLPLIEQSIQSGQSNQSDPSEAGESSPSD